MVTSRKWFVIAGLTLLSGSVKAQSSNETSAALEFKKVGAAMQSGDFEAAKKALIKAKGYIDLAAVNEKTQESPKTLYYKGEIYSSFLLLGMQTMDTNMIKMGGEDALDIAIASYKKGYEVSDKFDSDIRAGVDQKKIFLDQIATAMFSQKLFKETMELYDEQVKLSSAINVIDTGSIFNAGVCAENAGMWEKASDYYKHCAELNYRVPEIYKKIGVTLFNAGKNEEATVFLNKAVEKFPNDEYLFFYIGTMYIDLKDEAKATENLKKAVELNPKFKDAQYQLGKHYLDIATRLRDEASQLPQSENKKYNTMMAESADYYAKAAGPLEIYIAAEPNDKAVLICLYQINKSLKNTEKAAEYKKRADAL